MNTKLRMTDKQLPDGIRRVIMHPWFARAVSLSGALIYAFQGVYYAHSQVSVLDEGAYLLKGLLFVRGVYRPFQDYGPLTNHMPFSFLFHGLVQEWFGPGLRSGRYFSILLGLLLVIGLWVVVRNLSGERWAALTILAVAINPGIARLYSLATTQVMVACLLIWILVLVLGDDRPLWRTTLGAILAGILFLTRLNMAPVLILVVLYIYWEHGKRAGNWAAFSGALTLTVIHLVFWPGILKIWAFWIPEWVTPLLDPWRQPGGVRIWDPEVTPISRLLSLLQGLRVHFLPFTIVVGTFLFWKRPTEPRETRVMVFLSGLYGLLFFEHLAASVGLQYCIFCFPVYLSFFYPIGLFLFPIALSTWSQNPGRIRDLFAFIFILFYTAGIGFGAFGEIGEIIARVEVPRVRSLFSPADFAQGYPLWDILQARFGIPFETSKRFLPMLAGGLVGVLLLTIVYWVKQTNRNLPGSLGYSSFLGLVILGFFLTPTVLLGGGFYTYDCEKDMIRNYENAGHQLSQWIEPGSKVYWQGGDSAISLLYIPGIEIYPPQINGDYGYYFNDNTDRLLQFGLWNDSLADAWSQEADFILVEEGLSAGLIVDKIAAGGFLEVGTTTPLAPCQAGTEIRVYKHVQP